MGGEGVEFLLGLTQDVTFGPVITVGSGGVQAELLADVIHFLPTRDAGEIRRMISTLRGHALLSGYRGSAPADIDALCDAVIRLGALAIEAGERITEIDLNPVLVKADGQGIRLLDALVVCS